MDQVSKSNGVFDFFASVVLISGIVLFSLTALRGEYGLFSLFRVQAQQVLLQSELDALQADRERLQNKTRRLSNEYLDLDLLDEQARKVLGMARGDEIVIR